ncbi:hypothetical protein BH09ACT7_BH09ACT7_33560 [soil metagenome]
MDDNPGVIRPVVDDESAPRLALKPAPPASAYLDGAWWPRSTRLAAELPGLVTRLSGRLGEVAMVGYHLNAWTEVPPQLEIAGHTVQLQGFTSDEPGSVILIGRDGRYMAMLVIPPDASEEVARQELDAASTRADDSQAANDQIKWAADRSVTQVAARLAEHEGRDDIERTDEIKRWCEETARQFTNAPIQAFVPILVENIVRNRMEASRAQPHGE